jgi:diaminopimelate decarboxylase
MELNADVLNSLECELGESWYILDVERFKKNYRRLLESFKAIYPDTRLAYSYKTNYIPQLCKLIRDEGGYAEVVSDMEYDLAMAVGADPLKIIVNGPYKPLSALKKFLLNGSIVNLDSYPEYDALKMIAENNPDKILNIGIRCNFAFSGLSVSRFGFDITDPSFDSIFEYISRTKNIKLKILHCHYPNRDLALFGERVDYMVELYHRVSQFVIPPIIDIGGGLGGNLDDFIKRQLPYKVAEYSDYANLIATKFKIAFSNAIEKPTLMLEPGTAIVADTMKFICKITEIKNIRGKWIAMTSGTKINFLPMASKLSMPMTVFGKKTKAQKYYPSIDISGYTCMENDYLFRNYSGTLQVGDYLVFDNVGSYSVVFKPPFILPNVPIITFIDGKIEILKTRETFEYIFQTYKV